MLLLIRYLIAGNFYIGGVVIEGSAFVGTILPAQQVCVVTIDAVAKEFNIYQVLVSCDRPITKANHSFTVFLCSPLI